MGQDLEISILAKVRAFLGADDSTSPSQLYSSLRDYRTRIHPDKFQEDAQKKIAEQRFQEVQGLLADLMQFMQNRELTGTPSDIAIFEPQIDRIYLMREVDCLKGEIQSLKEKSEGLLNEIESLRQDVDYEKRRNSDLEAQLNDRAKEVLKAEAVEIENLYKPSLQSVAPVGMAILIAGTLSIMTKMEEVAALVRKYSPLEEHSLNTALLGIFVVSLGLFTRKMLEGMFLRRRAREITSPNFSDQFLAHLATMRVIDPQKVNTFTDNEAFAFIRGSAGCWQRVMAACGFHAYQTETANRLTDYFLATLLAKKLITVSEAELLNRSFVIKGRATRYYIP